MMNNPVATTAASNGGGGGEGGGPKRLFITHIDAFGPYLRISGQLNPGEMTHLRSKMQNLLSTCFAIDPNWPVSRHQPLLQTGTLCLYKNYSTPSNYEFVRVRILKSIVQHIPHQPESSMLQVEVECIDYGHTALVASYELLFPQHTEVLENIPTLCSQYILLGVCTDWKKSELDEILRMITHQTLDICIQMEFNHFKFINMKWKEFNFAEFLIHQRQIGAPIGNDLLRDNFKKILKQQQQQYCASGPQLTNNNNNDNYANNNINNNGVSGTEFGIDGGAASQMREQMAARRLVAMRQQQQQQQQQQQLMPMQNVVMHHPVQQPRMPHTIGNLRSMMQGINMQNNRIPYTGPKFDQVPSMLPVAVFNGANVMPAPAQLSAATAPNPNVYTARYQRPQPPQPLGSGVAYETLSPRRTSSATFKSSSLVVGNTYDVCVSFVENGPSLFSVQLQSAQKDLTEMMIEIERVQLKQFTEKPVLGTACIARYSEDGQLYRALITGVQPTHCKVAYIDYGNAELVKFHNLYEIPDEFLDARAFAIRFTLSGNKELEPIDESLKKTFKDLVIYKNCKLLVTPLEGPPLVQYCELYLQDQGILQVLKQIQKCRLVYAKSVPLQNNDIVEIRYIDSPKHFYVQKVANIVEFEQLMDDMFLYYNKNQLVPNHLALGAPCIVKYENEWYRAEVMRADQTAIIVRHVDFGYEQKVTKNLLSTIAEAHLKLPRQAVQCCLKGFENNELSKDLATTQFEMLAEESNRKRRSFTVKVFRIEPDGVNLVNLCTKDLNVMKKLYKLSMPFEQYLTLEKEEFNVNYGGGGSSSGHHKNGKNSGAGENGHKTPSIASSNDVASSVNSTSRKSSNILNSTALQSDERLQQPQQAQQHTTTAFVQKPLPSQQKQPPRFMSHNTSITSVSTPEWDKQSSASSVDNRDSRSSSSEHKQGKQQRPLQQRQRNPQQNANTLSIGSSASDRRSVGSGGSGSTYNNKRAGGGGVSNVVATSGNNTPPRFQNSKSEHDNRRQNKQQQQSTPPQQQRAQRPQNGPQGYSQPRQKTTTGSQCSNDAASSAAYTSDEHEPPQSEEYLPLERAFPSEPIETPAREEIVICWWISPHQFYTQIKSRIPQLETLMLALRKFYKKKPLKQLPLKVGSSVVARCRRDNTIYRARVLAVNHMLRKYKVKFVDFGNEYTVTSDDIFPLEKRFGDLACMAYLCSFHGIISNFDNLYIIDRMEKYMPEGALLTCEYIERDQNDMYFVNVNQNGISLKQTLMDEGIITEVCPELRLDLLVGQQIRAKISSIKDMLNFKIQIEGCDEHIKLLCSYDDVRYVKSNPSIAQTFKQFYEGKSCVVNIKDVNYNKVILLRPLLPLLKDDIPTYICTYPIILETFDVRVVYVASAYRVYVQLVSTDLQVATLLDDMYAHYEKEGTALNNFESGQICAANGSDSNWYRARIIAPSAKNTNPNKNSNNKNNDTTIEVYYIDYGNTEKLEKTKLKRLDEKFYINQSAYAIEINLPLRMLNQTATAADQQQQAATVINKLKELTLEKVLNAKALMTRRNHLIADIYLTAQKTVVDALNEQKLIKGRDIDYMRKLLDKEKSNMHEYIEMVDLTLEDEDEIEKKQSSKSNTSSPKKKKLATADKPAEIIVVPQVEQIEKAIEKPLKATKETPKSSVNVQAVKPIEAIPQPTPPVEVAAKTTTTPVVADPENQQPATVDVVEPQSEPVISEAPTVPIDPYAHMEKATLSHCDNPAQFFINPSDKLQELHNLQQNLQIVASSLPPLMNVCNGAYCISYYSVDKHWYRAQIMDAELMVLKFIDFGNTDCVSDATDIKEMSVFPDIASYCRPLALPIKPNGTADWVDAANAIFNESYSKTLHFEYIVRGDLQKRSYVNLFIDGVNVAERLIADGYARPLQVVTSGANCYISHMNNITDFYLQYEKDSKALELIEMYLADTAALPKIERFEQSAIVGAIFPDDEMWYRARLLRELPNDGGCEVLFIDYGNTSVSPECREICPKIAALPALSQKCALELPDNCLAWSDAAEEKFAEIAATGETIFTVDLREPAAEHAVVHLLIDGHNINADLEPLCAHKPVVTVAPEEPEVLNASFANISSSVYESGQLHDAIVSHANSPCDFYVQLNKDSGRLEDMTTSLNALGMDALQQPELGQLCAAVFSDDGALYRARIEEIIAADSRQCRVLFIDYGNEAITDDLRVLPQDLQQLKAFSRHCKLENSTRLVQFGAVAAETFNMLVDTCAGLVKVDIIDCDDNPAVVKLYAGNTEENLCETLNKLLGLDATVAKQSTANGPASVPAPMPPPNTCVISHAISPAHFYIQPASNSAKMDFLRQSLKHAADYDCLKSIEVGIVCSVYSDEDDCYYRGRVERILADSSYDIFLLDYGNSIVVKGTCLRVLSKHECAIPALALHCRLDASKKQNCNDSGLLAEHFVALVDSHFGEFYEIEADVLDSDSRTHVVRLQINYKDLAEELADAVARGAVAHVDAPLQSVLHQCSVIHVNSPASFYIQLPEDVAAVEQITDVLLDAETQFQAFDAPLKVGDLCAAQFPEDLAFYRAQIVRVLDDAAGHCEVHYLDFGNNSVTDQFRQLPESIRNSAGYSKHCSLDVPFASAEAEAHFKTLIDSRFSETFQVEFLKTSVDPQICRLFYQDRNVATELAQLLKGGDDSWLDIKNTHVAINPSSGVSSMLEEGEESGVSH